MCNTTKSFCGSVATVLLLVTGTPTQASDEYVVVQNEVCRKHYEEIVERLQPFASELAGKEILVTTTIVAGLVAGRGLSFRAQIAAQKEHLEISERICSLPELTDELKAAFDERLVAHELGHVVAHAVLLEIAKDSRRDHKLFGKAVHEGIAEDFAAKISRKAKTFVQTAAGLQKMCELSNQTEEKATLECRTANLWTGSQP